MGRIGPLLDLSAGEVPLLRDSTVITALILDRPMCVECIGRRTRLSEGAAQTALEIIRRAIGVRCADTGACSTCGKRVRVYSVPRPE